MKYIFFFLVSMVPATQPLLAQDKPAYIIYEAGGNSVSYDKMLKTLNKADVVFFGEEHQDPISHWLELQILKSLYEKDGTITLAMEMFEADDQIVLDEYLHGTIEESHLLKEAKVWSNYKTDYKPMIEFAKAKKLNVIATNIPRRYANLVYRRGIEALDSLPADAKKWIAPLPIPIDLTLPGYKKMIADMGEHAKSGSAENMARSQASKDATMEYFISKGKGRTFHVNGSYHSQNQEGILWYLKKSNPAVKTSTIHVVMQDKITSLNAENKNLADFIICVPSDMTKTY